MKTKKRRIELISFYDHTGLEKHFSKMAKKGWLIEKISNYYWVYRRIEPRDIHFCVTYYPRASDFDPEPSAEQQTFHDFCAHTGWVLACTWHQMQVFYNEKAEPIPLETDPVLEVQTLHSACKKNFLPSYFVLLAFGLIMGISFAGSIFVDPVGQLSNASRLVSGSCFVYMAIISLTELITYFLWYHRAKKAAADGVFVDTISTTGVQQSVLVLLLATFIGWIVNISASDDMLYKWIIILMAAYMITLLCIVNGIKQGLKKIKASRGVNKALTFIACFVLSFALTGGVTSLTLFATRSGYLEAGPQSVNIPLSLADLVEINEDDYIEEDRINQTVFLGQRVVHQLPDFEIENPIGMPDLQYVITTVKVPILYDWCKDRLFQRHDSEYTVKYKTEDALPWGANEAYRQIDDEGAEKTSFFLCYEDRFILIHLDWEPSEDQMAIIGEKLSL